MARAEERLVSLVVALRHRRMRAVDVLRSLPGYGVSRDADLRYDSRARRLFERDKDVLKRAGVELRSERSGRDTWYWIDAPAMPPEPAASSPASTTPEAPHTMLSVDDCRLLAQAVDAWGSGAQSELLESALMKLRAAAQGLPTGEKTAPLGVPVDLDAQADDLPPLLLACLREQRCVSFTYASASSPTRERTVQPHRVHRHAHSWCLYGVDVTELPGPSDSPAWRHFRLSRIDGEITASGPSHAFTASTHDPAPAEMTVRVAVAPGRAHALRAAGTLAAADDVPAADQPDTAELPAGTAHPEGWDVLVLHTRDDLWQVAGTLASFGPDVLVLAPHGLRDAVCACLRASIALAQTAGV